MMVWCGGVESGRQTFVQVQCRSGAINRGRVLFRERKHRVA